MQEAVAVVLKDGIDISLEAVLAHLRATGLATRKLHEQMVVCDAPRTASERIRKMMTSAPGGLHLGGPPQVEIVDPDRARVMQNLLFIDRAGSEFRRTLYSDELRRTAEGWRIYKRRCQFITSDGVRDRPDDR